MTPAARVHLDRRIAEERFTEIQPHGQAPEWMNLYDFVPHAWTMNIAGDVSASWAHLDEVRWSEVAAVRIEDQWGNPLDPATDEEDDFDGDFV